MRLRLRRLVLPVAVFACMMAIGTALVPRDPQPAATIDDLRTDPASYLGEFFSNTDAGLQGEFFGIQISNKVGNKFTGITIFSGLEGSVTAAGKFSARTVPGKAVSALGSHGRPGVFGGITEISMKGQLSAGGNAIIGTYKIKGTNPDKGTFYFLLDL